MFIVLSHQISFNYTISLTSPLYTSIVEPLYSTLKLNNLQLAHKKVSTA